MHNIRTIKRRVDEKRIRSQYVLTGSSNLLVQRNVLESLAGRAGYIPLLPLTRREQLGPGSEVEFNVAGTVLVARS